MLFSQTNILIIGASVSGLACAASLRKLDEDFVLIEKANEVAAPWRNHYERLHLHTNKRISSLPYLKFAKHVPRYPSRMEVVEYLDNYRSAFRIEPRFNTEAISVEKNESGWLTKTTLGNIQSTFVIMATGAYGKQKKIELKGMETFPGRIFHSAQYKTGKHFTGLNVLVIGFGNSACEIAIDLFEQGAIPIMSVRSAVNVIPRDVMGIPVLELSLLMKGLSPRFADRMNSPFMNLLVGNITKAGLKKLPYGPLEQISKTGTVPVLDIGTMKHIRKGHIKVFGEIDHIEGRKIVFSDGRDKDVDAIVAAIGYTRNSDGLVQVEQSRFEDLHRPIHNQQFFGKDGLYFCGHWISPTGQIREIASDAKIIAKHIGNKLNDGGRLFIES